MSDPLYDGPAVKRVQALLRRPEDKSIFMLGEGLLYTYAPRGVAFSAPYRAMGSELWAALEHEFYDLLCNASTKRPKDWASELVAGDARALIVALLTLLAAQYEMALAIAVPAAALIVKKRLAGLCAKKTRRPRRSVKTIMSYMKRHWSRKVYASYTSNPDPRTLRGRKRTPKFPPK